MGSPLIGRLAQALLAMLTVGALGLIMTGCGGGTGSGTAVPIPELESALADSLRSCAEIDDQVQAVACLSGVWATGVKGAADTAVRLPAMDRLAKKLGGVIGMSCHSTMHEVGRVYAEDSKITLANLQDVLPRTNDPGCSAGFAHGLLIKLGDEVVAAGPKRVSDLCHGYGTRYRVYSCIHGLGHAYLRKYERLPRALAACAALPKRDAPDCAQGAFHDYWFATAGVDQAKAKMPKGSNPRVVCAGVRPDFVAGCWYRAFLENPPRFPIREPSDLPRICAGLSPVQRDGCITAVNVVASPDPFEQLGGCARLAGPDASSCIRGVAVQQLAGAKPDEQRELVEGCRMFLATSQAGCVEWLARLMVVVTDGRFAQTGCSRLEPAAFREWCKRGAARVDEPLYTFS